jgi:hypothetical protein
LVTVGAGGRGLCLVLSNGNIHAVFGGWAPKEGPPESNPTSATVPLCKGAGRPCHYHDPQEA